MINRAREIAELMGYESVDDILEAIARGEVILLKVPESYRSRTSDWLHDRIPEAREESEVLAETIKDIANGLDMAMELVRYPADSDVCEMDLPHGWPSYCDKSLSTQN
jgi:hypothetical protein